MSGLMPAYWCVEMPLVTGIRSCWWRRYPQSYCFFLKYLFNASNRQSIQLWVIAGRWGSTGHASEDSAGTCTSAVVHALTWCLGDNHLCDRVRLFCFRPGETVPPGLPPTPESSVVTCAGDWGSDAGPVHALPWCYWDLGFIQARGERTGA